MPNNMLPKIVILLFLVSNISGVTHSKAAESRPSYTAAKPPKLIDLQSQTFLSSSVTVNGKSYKLASKKPISIRFAQKDISINAGCNTLGGSYNLSKNTLRTQTLFETKMACTEKLFTQDAWLNQLISSKPNIKIQYLSANSKIKAPIKILTIESSLTPWLKKGRTVIKLDLYETYGYADTPLGDQQSDATVKSLCDQLILNKASETQAQFAAEQNALLFRVRSREGVEYAGTSDYIQNRINVEILQGVINNCTQG